MRKFQLEKPLMTLPQIYMDEFWIMFESMIVNTWKQTYELYKHPFSYDHSDMKLVESVMEQDSEEKSYQNIRIHDSVWYANIAAFRKAYGIEG